MTCPYLYLFQKMEPHIEFLSKKFNPGEESYFHRERNNVRAHALIWKLDNYSEMERVLKQGS